MLCIIVVATFESLGLSNREKNLELRNLSNMVIAVENKDYSELSFSELSQVAVVKTPHSQEILNERIKHFTKKDLEDKSLERNKILLSAAIDQYIYENNEEHNLKYLSQEEKMRQIFTKLIRESACDSNTQDEKLHSDDFFFDI